MTSMLQKAPWFPLMAGVVAACATAREPAAPAQVRVGTVDASPGAVPPAPSSERSKLREVEPAPVAPRAHACRTSDDCRSKYGESDEGPPICCSGVCVDCFSDRDGDGIGDCTDSDPDLGCPVPKWKPECQSRSDCVALYGGASNQAALECCHGRCIDQPCTN